MSGDVHVQFSEGLRVKLPRSTQPHVKVGLKWHYLTVFIDLFSRIVVGWDLSESLERHSMIRAFQKAQGNRGKGFWFTATGAFSMPAPISGTCLRKGTSFKA